jgi:hypothetical protein
MYGSALYVATLAHAFPAALEGHMRIGQILPRQGVDVIYESALQATAYVCNENVIRLLGGMELLAMPGYVLIRSIFGCTIIERFRARGARDCGLFPTRSVSSNLVPLSFGIVWGNDRRVEKLVIG